jgi:hypothetical protein
LIDPIFTYFTLLPYFDGYASWCRLVEPEPKADVKEPRM